MSAKKYNYPKLIFAIIVAILLVFGLPYLVIHSASKEIRFGDERVELTEKAEMELITIFENFEKSEFDEYFEEDYKVQNDYLKEYTVYYKSGFNDERTYSLYLPCDEDIFMVKNDDTGRGRTYFAKEFNKQALYHDVLAFNKEYVDSHNTVDFELKTRSGKDSIVQGDVAYVIAKNVKFPAYLDIRCDEKSLICFPLKDGTEDAYVAIIPSTFETSPGKKDLNCSYSSELVSYSVNRDVIFEAGDFSTQNLTIAKDTVKEKRTEEAREELKNKMDLVFNKSPYDYEGSMDEFFAGFVLPVKGVLTTEYGVTRTINNEPSPYTHTGLDIGCPTGTDVLSTAKGKVAFADELILTGNTVVISHGFNIFSSYYHLDSLDCKKGELVEKGQKIGEVGTTGFSTGSHLHFEISEKYEEMEAGYFIYGEPVTYDNYNRLFK